MIERENYNFFFFLSSFIIIVEFDVEFDDSPGKT